jgi:hypothetical protein
VRDLPTSLPMRQYIDSSIDRLLSTPFGRRKLRELEREMRGSASRSSGEGGEDRSPNRYGVIHHTEDWAKPTGGTMGQDRYDMRPSSYPGIGEEVRSAGASIPGPKSMTAPEEMYKHLSLAIETA